jgi:hypothetical protein
MSSTHYDILLTAFLYGWTSTSIIYNTVKGKSNPLFQLVLPTIKIKPLLAHLWEKPFSSMKIIIGASVVK